jgi:bifunctional non-homologous end joining protein LigD
MLATKGLHVPGTERGAGEWVHEVKWDGVRILADSVAGAARLSTRNGNDVSVTWPDVVADVGRDLLVDGEVIALDAEGRPSFGVVAERLHVRSRTRAARLAEAVPATYMVFDVMRLDGRDLTGLPWAERRALLEALDLAGTGWQVPPTYDDGAMLLDATRAQGLEGIVSKRTGSRYEPGVRSRHWLKFAHRVRSSVVVGGWRPQEGTVNRLAALLVGEPGAEGLHYRGRVGSGIGGAASGALRARLASRTLAAPPFVDEVPRVDAAGTTWVEPFLVVEVESLGRSRLGRLRQPSFQGVREDLSPADLELPAPSPEGAE